MGAVPQDVVAYCEMLVYMVFRMDSVWLLATDNGERRTP